MGTTKVNESRIYAELTGIAGTWAMVDTIEMAIAVTKVADGGKPDESSYGRKSYGDITVSRPYDSTRDPDILKYLLALPVGWELQVMVHTCDTNDVILSTQTWNAGIKAVTTPKGDRQSESPAAIQIVLTNNGPV